MQYNITIQTNYFRQQYRVKRYTGTQVFEINWINIDFPENKIIWVVENVFDKTDE